MNRAFGLFFLSLLFVLTLKTAWGADSRTYYEVLGVPPTADQETIKKAYRRKAMDNHPDRFPNDEEKLKEFRAANDAYEVLGDEDKKKAYDELGEQAPSLKERSSSRSANPSRGQTHTASGRVHRATDGPAHVIMQTATYQIFLMERSLQWQRSRVGEALHSHMQNSRATTPVHLFRTSNFYKIVAMAPFGAALLAKPGEHFKTLLMTAPLAISFYALSTWYLQLQKLAGLCQIYGQLTHEDFFGYLHQMFDSVYHGRTEVKSRSGVQYPTGFLRVWHYTAFDLMKLSYERTLPESLPTRWQNYETLISLHFVARSKPELAGPFILRFAQMSKEAQKDFLPFLVANRLFWLSKIAEVEALAAMEGANLKKAAPRLAEIKAYLNSHTWLSSLKRGQIRCSYWMGRLFQIKTHPVIRGNEITPF